MENTFVQFPLNTKGAFATVDSKDVGKILGIRWYLSAKGYAYTSQKQYGRSTSMHRIILGNPSKLIDHKNGNRLDNRRDNLRRATASQNCMNAKKKKACSSVYKGVFWNKKLKKWVVQATIDRNVHYLGLFLSETEAAKSYNKFARKYFGEFALLNKI